jgi:hypothetical protein
MWTVQEAERDFSEDIAEARRVYIPSLRAVKLIIGERRLLRRLMRLWRS